MRPATLPPADCHVQRPEQWLRQRDLHGRPRSAEPLHLPAGAGEHWGDRRCQYCPLPAAVQFSGVTSNVALPPPIPARRLFQIPDAYTNGVAATYPPTPPTATSTVSNASDSGDPFINVTQVTGALASCGGDARLTSTTATRTSSGRVTSRFPPASRLHQPAFTWARTMARIPTTASTLTGGRR